MRLCGWGWDAVARNATFVPVSLVVIATQAPAMRVILGNAVELGGLCTPIVLSREISYGWTGGVLRLCRGCSAIAVAMLRRGLDQPVKVLGKGCFSTSTAFQAAAPAVAATSQKGFLSSLFGGSSRVTTPLTEALPGVALPSPAAVPSSAPKTELTTLSNGIKVASENTPVSDQSGRV